MWNLRLTVKEKGFNNHDWCHYCQQLAWLSYCFDGFSRALLGITGYWGQQPNEHRENWLACLGWHLVLLLNKLHGNLYPYMFDRESSLVEGKRNLSSQPVLPQRRCQVPSYAQDYYFDLDFFDCSVHGILQNIWALLVSAIFFSQDAPSSVFQWNGQLEHRFGRNFNF